MHEFEIIAKNLIGEYGWLIFGGLCALLLKTTVGNMVAGALFMYGSDFDVDDVVYIGGTTKARIVRQTHTKTVFHILDSDRKLIIPNTDLYKMRCEKVLPGSKNGDEL
jgi:hypothetical protein